MVNDEAPGIPISMSELEALTEWDGLAMLLLKSVPTSA
jgi:hypothetical protein